MCNASVCDDDHEEHEDGVTLTEEEALLLVSVS